MDKKTTNNLVLFAIGAGVAYYLYTMYAVSKGFGSSKDTNINDYVPSSSENSSTETVAEKVTDKPINQNDSYNMRVFWVRKKWGLNTEDSKAVVDKADSIVANPDSDWAQSVQAKATERGNSFYQQAINDAYWILFGPGSEAGIEYNPGEGSIIMGEGDSDFEDNVINEPENISNGGNSVSNTGSGGPAPGGDGYLDYEEMMDADMLASGDWVMMGINGKTNFVG